MSNENKNVVPAVPVSPVPASRMCPRTRIPVSGIEPGSLHGRRADFNPEPQQEPGQEHRDLLRKVGKMDAAEFKTFKNNPANLKALDAAQRWKRGNQE